MAVIEGQCRFTGVFFFQAEDGIRDYKVTGVQTCALPIWVTPEPPRSAASHGVEVMFAQPAVVQGGGYQRPVAPRVREALQIPQRADPATQIGRASCRERV